MDQNLLRDVEKRLPLMPPEVQQKVGQLLAEARKAGTQETEEGQTKKGYG